MLTNKDYLFEDTIVALSTPMGMGAIAVVRISGKEAITIAEKTIGKTLFPTTETSNTTTIPKRTIVFARIKDLDDVVVSAFRAPHSFTGEDMVEISCHGSIYIQEELVRRLIDNGCRSAKAGEFTERAFANGKMDLSQAEAVADLIASQSAAEQRLALSHLRGGISEELKKLREQLLHFTSLVELELDFADHEDLEFADRGELSRLANQIEIHLSGLVNSFVAGNAIKNGIGVAIVGAPNAGKSTLLNALLNEERAIVSDREGTTRDTIEESFIINGYRFRLIDTAGIRATTDSIEQLGIERSRKAIDEAQIIVEVRDITSPQELNITVKNNQRYLIANNKIDISNNNDENIVNQTDNKYICNISAREKRVEPLKKLLTDIAKEMTHTEGVAISNARHYEALKVALEAIHRVQTGLTNNVSGEFMAMDMQDCLQALAEITGEISSQDILNNIFSKFCIGK